jgi:hypothetical protein
MYYDLVDDMTLPYRWHLADPVSDEGCDPSDFKRGAPLNIRSTPTIEVNVPGIALDFTLTDLAVPIASHRLATAVTEVAGQDLQCIPVRVGARDKYNILNATRLIRCLDEERSEFIKWTERDGRPDRTGSYRMVTTLVLDPTLIPRGTHIFRIYGWCICLIVSQDVLDAITPLNAIGPIFRPVT